MTTVPREETWNLADLYEDEAAYETAKQAFRDGLSHLDELKGRLGESGDMLAEALDRITEAAKLFGRLRCYAVLRADGDTRRAADQARRQEVELLATEFSRRTSYLRPEILALDPEAVEGFLKEEPRLADYAHFLRDLMRQKSHVLGPAEERIMAETGLLTRAPNTLFQTLNNVELPRAEVTLSTGEKARLTPVGFYRHRVSSHRPDRQKVFPEYFRAYADFKDTLGQNVHAAVKSHLFRARVRGYDSCLAAALDPDNVPTSVYRNLVSHVRGRLPVVQRYFRLRARALGLRQLEYPDMYCPLGGTRPREYAPRGARELVHACLEPLGEEYRRALEQAFDERWIDWHPTTGKRSGAYATGWAYDVHPYVLLNYIGDYDSVSTLAHEMGHAMHSYFSNRKQPYAIADYSIFVAEVASTLNEALLNHHMQERSESRDEQLFLLTSQLDGIRGTLFRQTMFAEFELEIHERVERGEVLTGESLNEIYLELLRDYHGHGAGVVHIDDAYAVEWAAIPHMYYDFYVYQYATGIIAATALAEALLTGDGDAQERYLGFLGAGGADYPLEVLRRAGVDLESAEPYESALNAFERQGDRLEGLL
jgi:oligoendopeptidase F